MATLAPKMLDCWYLRTR